MTKRVAPLTHKQITGPAAAAFQALPNNLRQSILFHLEDRPHAVLYDKREIVKAWLSWEGIQGFTDQIIELVRTTYTAQEAPALTQKTAQEEIDSEICPYCDQQMHNWYSNGDGDRMCCACYESMPDLAKAEFWKADNKHPIQAGLDRTTSGAIGQP